MLKCDICGRDCRALVSYAALKTKFKLACKECYKKMGGKI